MIPSQDTCLGCRFRLQLQFLGASHMGGNQLMFLFHIDVSISKINKQVRLTSGQDRGIGRYTLPPRTTKRRTTTNLKTKNNYNCQKVKLYGSLTTKELKKKHSSTLVEGRRCAAGWRGLLARQQLQDQGRQGSDWQTRRSGSLWTEWSHSRADKLGGTTGERDRPHNPGF